MFRYCEQKSTTEVQESFLYRMQIFLAFLYTV